MNMVKGFLALVLGVSIAGCGSSGNGDGNVLTPTPVATQTQTRQMGGSTQTGNGLSLTGTVTTFAGSSGSYGSADGNGTDARFNSTGGITTDGSSLYVVDSGNQTIRKVAIGTGAVTVFAGTTGVSGSANGAGTSATFNAPSGITTDGTDLYLAEYYSNTIRRINIATGAVSTLAGTAGTWGSTDGTGSAARFYGLSGITTDGRDLFAVDASNKTIRRISIASGAVTTLAGSPGISGSTDGTGSAARFTSPSGITTDGVYLFVTDNQTIRKIDLATGAVTTIAGSPGVTGSADSTGSAARFNTPVGITTDGTSLFVSDLGNYTVRKIAIASNAVTTIAGSAGAAGSTDGIGAAARFTYPGSVTTDGTNLFVVANFAVRRIQ